MTSFILDDTNRRFNCEVRLSIRHRSDIIGRQQALLDDTIALEATLPPVRVTVVDDGDNIILAQLQLGLVLGLIIVFGADFRLDNRNKMTME